MNEFGKQELKRFLQQCLSKRELEILLSLEKLQGNTFSSITKVLSNDYPESTIKDILRKFSKKRLISCGNSKNKGLPLMFTNLGDFIYGVMVQSGKTTVSKTVNGSSNLPDPTKKRGDKLWKVN